MQVLKHFVLLLVYLKTSCFAQTNFISYDPRVACDEEYIPDYCGLPNIPLELMLDVEDFDRCGPAALPKITRNYFWAGNGRKITYSANLANYKKLSIVPKYMRDISRNTLETTILGQRIEFPIGLSPIAAQQLAHQDGEIGSARAAISRLGTVMILSSMSTTSMEDLADAVRRSSPDRPPVMWIQSYPQKNRQNMMELVRRAEMQGFGAIVITMDMQSTATVNCDSRHGLLARLLTFPNLVNGTFSEQDLDPEASFEYLRWLSYNTRLPIVAKGILTGPGAEMAVRAGASAILVSNHGGRQLDGVQATIDALPEVVRALKKYPQVEVYLDGGVRHGQDVFKALALGARAVFVGRPIIWGLAIGGEEGVFKMLTILRKEFNETMLIAGARFPQEIGRSFVKQTSSCSSSWSSFPFTNWPELFTQKR